MQNKILKKLFNTTVTMFIILTILTINKTSNTNTLRTNLQIENIIKYLTISNNKTPSGLKAYLPKNIKLINYFIGNNTLTVNLSKEFMNTNNLDLQVTGLVYSLLELNDIDNIKIQVEGKQLDNYNKLLNRNLGINNKYLFNNRYDISKVTVYYIDKIGNKEYYVPVTKYVNDTRNKVEIIVDELKLSDNNLISYLNDNVKLLNYREEANVLFLNFNNYLLDQNKKIYNEILNTIAYSIFDNYDVNVVCFEINSKRVDLITKDK